jgi:DNA-binding CsgD family transcriptional regulator
LLRNGSRAAGGAALAEASDLYRDAGAVGAAGRVDALRRPAATRSSGSSASARPTEGWAALTAAEHRVAELVATGHSNRAVADQLFVSPNTVATHLRAVFTKLDINSRVQLAHAFHTRQV